MLGLVWRTMTPPLEAVSCSKSFGNILTGFSQERLKYCSSLNQNVPITPIFLKLR